MGWSAPDWYRPLLPVGVVVGAAQKAIGWDPQEFAGDNQQLVCFAMVRQHEWERGLNGCASPEQKKGTQERMSGKHEIESKPASTCGTI